jgi:hypothetical protein
MSSGRARGRRGSYRRVRFFGRPRIQDSIVPPDADRTSGKFAQPEFIAGPLASFLIDAFMDKIEARRKTCAVNAILPAVSIGIFALISPIMSDVTSLLTCNEAQRDP